MSQNLQKALELINKHKLIALARETELQDQARLCHQEATELANLEYSVKAWDETKLAALIKDLS